jgi:hypothetical protein
MTISIDLTVIMAIVSFVGAIMGAALSNLVTARLADQERKEARRKERLASLIDIQNQLTACYVTVGAS